MTYEGPQNPVDRLSIRLARLACDVDDVIQELERVDLVEGDDALLSAPLLHFEIASGGLRQRLYELEGSGRSRSRVHEAAA